MSRDNWLSKFSKLQCNINEKHPILSQFLVNLISGLLVIIIPGCWAINNVPPKTRAKIEKISPDSSQISIINEGFMPANNIYEIATGDVVELKPNIVLGEKYISDIKPVSKNRYVIELKNLPKSQKVLVNFNTGEVSVEEK